MKKIIQIVLLLVILGLGYVLYQSIMKPIRFQSETKVRETAIIEKLKNIRSAERMFKASYGYFTGSFDTLTSFILDSTLTFARTVGDVNDSLQVAQGLVYKEDYRVLAKDTIFGREFPVERVKELKKLPYTDNKEFILEAGMLATESGVVVPVVSCRAPYKEFLADLDKQEVINLLDVCKISNRYGGLKFGSMTEATNESGNWE